MLNITETSNIETNSELNKNHNPYSQFLPWAVKHAPSSMEHLVIHDDIREKINYILDTKKPCILLLFGDSGVGKSSTAKVTAECLTKGGEPPLIINASDDRCIILITYLKTYCKAKTRGSKVIVLEEIDGCEIKTMNALCSIMDSYCDKITFIITCNRVTEILENIQSRCDNIFHFTTIKVDHIAKRLQQICKIENVSYDDVSTLRDIGVLSQGDMRKAINILHSIVVVHKKVNIETLKNSSNIPHHSHIFELIKRAQKDTCLEVVEKMKDLCNKGFRTQDILHSIFNAMTHEICDEFLVEDDKILVLDTVCNVLYRIKSVHDSFNQSIGFCCQLWYAFYQKNKKSTNKE